MYHITASPFGPYTQIILENKISQTGFSLVPAEGGTVCDLWFNGQSVLDGHNTPEALQGGKWGKSSVLFPFPNRMLDGKYTWEGQEYQFPITNKDTGNAIHGFVRHLAFEVVAQEAKSDAASITVALKYDGHLAYYPFPFLLELRFTIQDNGIFEMHTAITNLHHHAIPVGL